MMKYSLFLTKTLAACALGNIAVMNSAYSALVTLDAGTPTDTDPSGAILRLEPFQTSGTGAISPFLRLQTANGQTSTETAFNTSANPTPPDGVPGPFTRDLLLSDLQVQNVFGGSYYQFSLDFNEVQSGPDPFLTLTTFDLYSGTVANRTNLAGATLEFSLVDDYRISTLNAGSGAGDVQIYVPTSYFTDAVPGPFLTLNATFTEADAGFEEISAVTGPNPPRTVPDGGSALAFLGMSIMGLEALRRKLRTP